MKSKVENIYIYGEIEFYLVFYRDFIIESLEGFV